MQTPVKYKMQFFFFNFSTYSYTTTPSITLPSCSRLELRAFVRTVFSPVRVTAAMPYLRNKPWLPLGTPVAMVAVVVARVFSWCTQPARLSGRE